VYERDYPFAWLGILAAVAPSTEEVMYARHDRGFALHSLRSPEVSRLYIQVDPDAELADWSDDRLWEELSLRLASDDGFALKSGPILERSIAVHRSVVVEPMQYGRLFWQATPRISSRRRAPKAKPRRRPMCAISPAPSPRWYRKGERALLDGYTERCLGRVWRVQQFSTYMTTMSIHGSKLPASGNRTAGLARIYPAAPRSPLCPTRG